HSGHTFDATRAHLEAGLDRLAEPLLASGQLDSRRFQELTTRLDRDPESPGSLTALVASYRTVVSEIAEAVEHPTLARQEGGVQRGLAFMREHLYEPLTLHQVARVAGFAPKYFSRLLERKEGQSFEPLLQTLRIERAKHLLTSTAQSVATVALGSGFKSRTYFQQLFRERAGVTPLEHRRRTRANVL
ncbi:MAG TPA: AraC family transcriptional regulator, partial [Polyangiaceae bacterium]|nr:AraC family transcriptional regulator [Polyangiaceae bacterium]